MSTTQTNPAVEPLKREAEYGGSRQAGASRAFVRSGRSRGKALWYRSLQILTRTSFPLLFRFRSDGRRHLRFSGGGIVLSNHQSHLDPVLVGTASDRHLNFLARESLFKFTPLAMLIRSLDAIPLDRDRSGLGGLKETLKRLKQGELVLIFGEGTRTPDGNVHTLKPGFLALARRSQVPLVPVGIDGAYRAWPKQRALPWFAPIRVEIGEPLLPEEYARLTDDELLAEMQRRIDACHARARNRLRIANCGEPKTLCL